MHGSYYGYCYVPNVAHWLNCFLGLNYYPKTAKNTQIGHIDDLADVLLYYAEQAHILWVNLTGLNMQLIVPQINTQLKIVSNK